MRGRPVRRASLIAASIASAPELPKKTRRPPVSRRSRSAELELGWRGEVVRDVREGRRLARHGIHEDRVRVTERVDRDAGEEVEVLGALDVPHPGALAPDEHGERRWDRLHHRVGAPVPIRRVVAARPVQRVHAGTTSVPMPASVKISSRIECGRRPSMTAALGTPPLDRLEAGRHLGDHAALQVRKQADELGGADDRHQRFPVGPVAVETLDIGEHDQLGGAERHGERSRGRVGVHIERLTGHLDVGRDRRHDRDAAGIHFRQHRDRIDLDHVADQSDINHVPVDKHPAPRAAEQPGVLARDRRGQGAVLVDHGDQLATDLAGQHHAHDLHRLGRGHPVPSDELARDAQPLEHRGDLRPAAVHHDRLDADMPQVDHVFGEGPLQSLVDHGVATELDHDDLAGELPQPRQALDEGGGFRLGMGEARVGGVHLLVGHEAYAEFSCT